MKPFSGIKIVDFTQAHAGSLATMLLADYGAEVIKIERAGTGDLARYWEPMVGDDSGYYAFLNRNKKSMAINASDKEGKQIVYDLIKDADIVCENFKYGSMDRMGFDYDTIKKINPEIIYASLNGFGQTGEMINEIGLDLQLQSMSGLMDRTGFPDGAPTKVGAAFGDHLSGMYMATAINLALIHKTLTGKGQKVDIAILDSIFSVLEDAPIINELTGKNTSRVGNAYPSMAPYDTLKTKDGYVTVAVSTDKQWKMFCEALELTDLLSDSSYKLNEDRCTAYTEVLKPRLEKEFATMSKFDIEDKLTASGVSASAVRDVREIMKNEQIIAREVIQEVEDKRLGKISYPAPIIKLSETPGSIEHTAPLMGEDTEYYLKQLGYSEEKIQNLIESGAVEIAQEVK